MTYDEIKEKIEGKSVIEALTILIEISEANAADHKTINKVFEEIVLPQLYL